MDESVDESDPDEEAEEKGGVESLDPLSQALPPDLHQTLHLAF